LCLDRGGNRCYDKKEDKNNPDYYYGTDKAKPAVRRGRKAQDLATEDSRAAEGERKAGSVFFENEKGAEKRMFHIALRGSAGFCNCMISEPSITQYKMFHLWRTTS
jgi:hypothetical protein